MTFAFPVAPRLRPLLLFAGLVLIIVCAEHVITTRPVFYRRPELPMAVAFDLLVVIPALFYGLVVRRYRLPVSSVVGVAGACLALAFWLLPVSRQQPLHALAFLPVLLEGASLIFAIARAGRLWRAYCAARQHTGWVQSLATAVPQVLGLAGIILVSEITTLCYATLGWWARADARPYHAAFSGHRESGFLASMGAVSFLVLIETVVVHLVVGHWYPVVAWWLSGLGLYTLLLLVAHAHAVRLCPLLLTVDKLDVRVGFAWQLTVPRAAVVAAQAIREAPAAESAILNAAKALLAAPNVLLSFAAPVVVTGPYGINRTVRCMALHLDQPQAFLAALAGGLDV